MSSSSGQVGASNYLYPAYLASAPPAYRPYPTGKPYQEQIADAHQQYNGIYNQQYQMGSDDTSDLQQHADQYGSRVKTEGGVKCSQNGKRVALVVLSVAITVLTALAAYYALSNGFARLDVATTGMQRFIGGALVYVGGVFAITAFVNALLSLGALCGKYNASKTTVALQAGISLAAPILAIPGAIVTGMLAGLGR